MSTTPGSTTLNNDQLKARYIGTGHADLPKYEWMTNQHRDTYASLLGHYDQLSYMAVARNESIGRIRLEFLQKMVQPCGPAPQTKDIDKILQDQQQDGED